MIDDMPGVRDEAGELMKAATKNGVWTFDLIHADLESVIAAKSEWS